jgi:uncharacterized membrane protein
MYSKVNVGGHPIHPMLVGFPIAFYAATVTALVIYGGVGNPFWYHAAFCACVAGVVMAVIASAFGVLDMLGLPAQSRARNTGLQHLAFNGLTLGLFTIDAIVLGVNWYSAGRLHFGWPLVLGLIGLASLAIAGSLGWKLVQTHHVGIKPTVYPTAMRPIEDAEDLDELPYSAQTAGESARQIQIH